MNLQDFMFPVTERQVAVNDLHHNGARWKDNQTFLPSPRTKPLYGKTPTQVISIVRDTYQLVRNERTDPIPSGSAGRAKHLLPTRPFAFFRSKRAHATANHLPGSYACRTLKAISPSVYSCTNSLRPERGRTHVLRGYPKHLPPMA